MSKCPLENFMILFFFSSCSYFRACIYNEYSAVLIHFKGMKKEERKETIAFLLYLNSKVRKL